VIEFYVVGKELAKFCRIAVIISSPEQAVFLKDGGLYFCSSACAKELEKQKELINVNIIERWYLIFIT